MNDNYERLRKWAKDAASGKSDKIPYIDITDLIDEVGRLREAARATPAQPVPMAKYAEEMKQMAEIHRIELQRMFDAPANPCEAAFKEKTLSQGSQPKEWDDTAPVMVWYGYCEFKKGYEASQPSTSTVAEAIRKLPLPEPFEYVAVGALKAVQSPRYTSTQMHELLSEAAAHAEQVQGQQVGKFVPLVPTREMQKAYFDVIDKNLKRVSTDPRFGRWESMREAYTAMLAAAPSITQDGQKSEGA